MQERLNNPQQSEIKKARPEDALIGIFAKPENRWKYERAQREGTFQGKPPKSC